MVFDWQTGFQSIKDRGLFLLHSEKWADCKFLVGSAPNQITLTGHKVLLAMASPVFERMFYGDLPEESNPILIPDVKPDAFQAMLEYIYSDRINIKSFDKACELVYVAKKYMLPHLAEQGVKFVRDNINKKTACRAYEFAKLFDECNVIHASMNFIVNNTRDVLMDPSFMDIEISTLMDILDRDYLNITSELDLFNALNKYSEEKGLFVEKGDYSINEANNTSENISKLCLNDVENNISEIAKNENETTCSREDNNTSGNIDETENKPNKSTSHVDINVVTESSNQEETNDSLIHQALWKIRFLSLTPQQFALGPARSKLLQKHESLDILLNILSPTRNDCSMPVGFSKTRFKRNNIFLAKPVKNG